MKKRAIIFANGELRDASQLRTQITLNDFLIAADGGYKHMKALEMMPNLIIGDLDSMVDKDVEKLQHEGVEILRFSNDKDETDLELALLEARKRGFIDLLIVAGLGGRLDQTLGNLWLLSLPELDDCQVKLEDGCEEVWRLTPGMPDHGLNIKGEPGDRVSLLALSFRAEGITTQGLKYPLTNETLARHQTRGISNEMLTNTARVNLRAGELIVIHTRKKSGCLN